MNVCANTGERIAEALRTQTMFGDVFELVDRYKGTLQSLLWFY